MVMELARMKTECPNCQIHGAPSCKIHGTKAEPLWKKVLEEISYEDLREMLANLPLTWYPDLLSTMVKAARDHQVFRVGRIPQFIKKVLDE